MSLWKRIKARFFSPPLEIPIWRNPRTELVPVKEARVSEPALSQFWQDWEKDKRASGLLRAREWKRQAIPVTHSVAGTVRRFRSVEHAKYYIVEQKGFEEAIEKANPKNFVLQRMQFLSRNGPNLLERVYLAPTLADLTIERPESRYFLAFQRRMERKGFRWNEIKGQVKEDANRAYYELVEIAGRTAFIHLDISQLNSLALDYDPVERKFLIALIDIGGSTPE